MVCGYCEFECTYMFVVLSWSTLSDVKSIHFVLRCFHLLLLFFHQKSIVEFKSGENSNQEDVLHSYEGAVCGSISGGFAAAVTTPLDVIKTRLMLGSVSCAIR